MTPRATPRTADGWYTIEAQWDSSQQTVRQETIEPWVVVGTELYPMQRVPLLTNRWEAAIPVPDGQRFVNYRLKFDYRYNTFGLAQPDSKSTATYVLEVVD